MASYAGLIYVTAAILQTSTDLQSMATLKTIYIGHKQMKI